MTVALSGKDVAARLEQRFPDAIIASDEADLLVESGSLHDIISHLKDAPEYKFNYFANVTAVDYFDYFEVVYHLTSMEHNHKMVLKTRCYGRENPSVPSVTDLYEGANFQEREVYDLMGITFEGHPNLKRILLWDGFEGHPLRKDYL